MRQMRTLIGLLAAVRSFFPRVLFLPPSKFKAGFPTDYPIGEVSEKFKQDYRTWIIRTNFEKASRYRRGAQTI